MVQIRIVFYGVMLDLIKECWHKAWRLTNGEKEVVVLFYSGALQTEKKKNNNFFDTK